MFSPRVLDGAQSDELRVGELERAGDAFRCNPQTPGDLGRAEPVVAEAQSNRVGLRQQFDRRGTVHDNRPYGGGRTSSSVEHYLLFPGRHGEGRHAAKRELQPDGASMSASSLRSLTPSLR